MVLGVAVVLAGALTAGAWTHLTQYRVSADAAEQRRDFVPQVRVASVEPSGEIETVELPATTSAFASANIFARASGYIAKREVDIGDRVKTRTIAGRDRGARARSSDRAGRSHAGTAEMGTAAG